MLYVKCEKCEAEIPTGIAVSKDSKGTILKKNVIMCPRCGKSNIWSGENAFRNNGTPFISE